MKTLFALAAGYVLGATAGSRDFDELFDSVRAIRDSEEFHDFLSAAAVPRQPHVARARRHARARRSGGGDSNDLVERVKQMAVRG